MSRMIRNEKMSKEGGKGERMGSAELRVARRGKK
jgi:hypothetical protein